MFSIRSGGPPAYRALTLVCIVAGFVLFVLAGCEERLYAWPSDWPGGYTPPVEVEAFYPAPTKVGESAQIAFTLANKGNSVEHINIHAHDGKCPWAIFQLDCKPEPSLFDGFVLTRTEPPYTRDVIHLRYRMLEFPGLATGGEQRIVLHLAARVPGEYLVQTYVDTERGSELGRFRGPIRVVP